MILSEKETSPYKNKPGHSHGAGIDTESAETFGDSLFVVGVDLREPAECLVLEPAREEDDLSAAPVPVLAGQPDQPDHLLQRLVGGVHEGLLADLAAVQRLAFPILNRELS